LTQNPKMVSWWFWQGKMKIPPNQIQAQTQIQPTIVVIVDNF